MIKAIVLSFLVSWITPAAGTVADEGHGSGGGKTVQGSGERVTKTFELDAYTAIELSVAADMRVSIGKPTPLTIEADDNILPLIKVEVVDGSLKISTKHNFSTKDSPNITVTVAALNAVAVTGSGDMHVTKIDNEELIASATGAADLHLSGKTNTLTLAATGSADVEAYELDSRDAKVTLTGASDANISVDGSLTVTIVGAGDLNYKGDAKVTQAIVGSGDVTKVGPSNKT